MRGISEERLRELFEEYQHRFLSSQLEKMYEPHAVMNTLHALLDECQELSQWQPIESAPKDRDLILLFDDIGAIQGKWSEFGLSHVPNELIYFKNRPTHWLALPSDPLSLPMPPAEAPNPGPHTPSADIGPEVPEHG